MCVCCAWGWGLSERCSRPSVCALTDVDVVGNDGALGSDEGEGRSAEAPPRAEEASAEGK